jgi:tetratricopeptide (TPR) repeat protein
MTVDRAFVPAYVNLADLERATGNEAEAERLLREAMALAPQSGVAAHALGLSLVRQRKVSEALAALKEACAANRQRPVCLRLRRGIARHRQPGRAVRLLEAAAASSWRRPFAMHCRVPARLERCLSAARNSHRVCELADHHGAEPDADRRRAG